MSNPFLETYNSKTTQALLDILKKVIQDTTNVGKMELEAIVTILDTRELTYLESQEYDQILERQDKEMALELSNQSINKEAFSALTNNHTTSPVVEQTYSNRQTNQSFEKTIETKEDNTLDILMNANPVNHGSRHHQYMPNEVELFKSEGGSLILTSHRLFYQNSRTTVALAVDDISFIGYKRTTNYIMLIIGGLLGILGVAALGTGDIKGGQGSIGLFLALGGIVLILAARKKYVIFATSGGEMLINDNLADLRSWIDKVFIAKENLIKQRKFS
jgi:hypothetical protein